MASKKHVTADELHQEWMQDSEYAAAYEAMDEEFALADALIAARTRAGLTQEQVAERMQTSQAAVARIESGRTMPSTRTLRRYAAATNSKLHFSLVPA